MGKAFRDVMWLLGLLLAAPTIISLIQHIFSVGLAPYFADIVAFYRGLVAPVFDVLYWPLERLFDLLKLDWTIPEWVSWLHVLSFVGAGLLWKSLDATIANPTVESRIGGLATQLVVGITFLGLIGLWMAGVFFIYGKRFQKLNPEEIDVNMVGAFASRIRQYSLATAAAVIVFYVSNAATLQFG